MPATPSEREAHVIDVPSMLDLIRLSPRALFPPGGVDLYRQIALLTDMAEGDEVLHVACGKAVSLEYFVREFGVHGSGVEADPRLVEEAEKRTRAAGLTGRVQIQTGRPDALPYRDEIFDITVGEIGLSARCDPARAVEELVRVTKPGGSVVLVQLVWKTGVDEARQRLVRSWLGARPLMIVEWKRRLKEAGVENLHTEDWSDDETSFRAKGVKPFPDFTEIFSFPEKVDILRRAWGRWGWAGIRALLAREREIHRLLTRERTIGLDLMKGTKAAASGPAPKADGARRQPARSAPPAEEAPSSGHEKVPSPAAAEPRPSAPDTPDGEDPPPEADANETAGLPLFGSATEGGT